MSYFYQITFPTLIIWLESFTYTISTLRNQVQLFIGFFLHIEYSLCTKLTDIVTEKEKININKQSFIIIFNIHINF